MNSEKQYTQAFNNGYILAQHVPKLLNTISKTLAPANNYLEGLFAGMEEFELERNKSHILEIGKLREQGNYRDLEM